MRRVPRISESEWEVLSILWKKAPLAATQVFEKLAGKSWKLSTVRTFLARLEKKGVVQSLESREAKTYHEIGALTLIMQVIWHENIQARSDNALQDVDRHNERAPPGTEDPERIGSTCIPTAIFTDIYPEEIPAYPYSGWN